MGETCRCCCCCASTARSTQPPHHHQRGKQMPIWQRPTGSQSTTIVLCLVWCTQYAPHQINPARSRPAAAAGRNTKTSTPIHIHLRIFQRAPRTKNQSAFALDVSQSAAAAQRECKGRCRQTPDTNRSLSSAGLTSPDDQASGWTRRAGYKRPSPPTDDDESPTSHHHQCLVPLTAGCGRYNRATTNSRLLFPFLVVSGAGRELSQEQLRGSAHGPHSSPYAVAA
ncbi:hypothetical protein QBC39DRAFT_336718 [Podospora conica]|nr:hypothetical protein QBC39DRAFT_336718 [Schizothecium conicum]